MKKTILFALAVVLVFSGVFGGLMVGLKPEKAESEEEGYFLSEEERECGYEFDCVLVSLTVEASRTGKEYTIEDFQSDNIENVSENTSFSDDIWKYLYTYWEAEKISPEAAKKVEEENLRSDTPYYINAAEFRRMFRLDLKSDTKEGVLNTIEILEQLGFVDSASPNYFFFADLEF